MPSVVAMTLWVYHMMYMATWGRKEFPLWRGTSYWSAAGTPT